jgi:hypothetical protein
MGKNQPLLEIKLGDVLKVIRVLPKGAGSSKLNKDITNKFCFQIVMDQSLMEIGGDETEG